MNISITNKRRYWILSFLLGIYTTLGICTNLEKRGVDHLLERYERRDLSTFLYAHLMVGIKNKSYTLVTFGIMAVCIIFMFAIIFAHNYKKRELFVSFILALFYSLSIWFGIVFQKNDNWNDYICNKYILLKDVMFLTGWILLLMTALLLLTSFIKRYFMDCSVSRRNTGKELLKIFFGTVIVIFIMWLPCMYFFYPGMIHGDTLMEVAQYHHFPIRFQNRWVTDGVNIIYSNDHPFVHTILFGKVLDIGTKIHNYPLVIWGFCLVQLVCLIMAYAGLITSLYYFGVNKNALICACLIYGAIPIFPMYAMLIGGDSALALVFTCFMIHIIWIYQTNGEIMKSKKFMILFMINIFAMAIIKNQGIYIAIVTLLFIVLIFRRNWKRNLLVTLIPLTIFYVGYEGLLFQAMKIGKVGRQEALSVFFQQTARCVKYHNDEITKEEKESIAKILDYDIIGRVYQPNLSDYVKKTFHEEANSEDMRKYFITWLNMGIKYPGEYIQSFIASTWKYYSPLSYDCNIYYHSLNTVKGYCRIRSWTKDVIPESFQNEMNWELDKNTKEKREIAYHYLLFTKHIPIINWFVLPGYLVWLMLLSFYIMWTRHNYKMIITFLPVFLVFGVCLLSPVNGNVRYLLPAYCLIPTMIAMAFGDPKE